MNCNNNTTPLITSTTQGTCTTSCEIKDIQVVCKKIIIPYGQDIIGIQGENNVSSRTFLVPITSENGIDLSNAQFSILYKLQGAETQEIQLKSTQVGNYIKLVWDIDYKITETNGNVQVQIKAIGDNFIWKTYSAIFKVAESL